MGDRIRGWDPKGGTGHGILTFLALVERASRGERAPGTAAAGADVPSSPSVAKAAPRGAGTKKSKKSTDKGSRATKAEASVPADDRPKKRKRR
jgi:hypothetical protein